MKQIDKGKITAEKRYVDQLFDSFVFFFLNQGPKLFNSLTTDVLN